LSKLNETSAMPSGLRRSLPAKMTSSVLVERSDFVLTNNQSIREAIPFPLQRPT